MDIADICLFHIILCSFFYSAHRDGRPCYTQYGKSLALRFLEQEEVWFSSNSCRMPTPDSLLREKNKLTCLNHCGQVSINAAKFNPDWYKWPVGKSKNSWQKKQEWFWLEDTKPKNCKDREKKTLTDLPKSVLGKGVQFFFSLSFPTEALCILRASIYSSIQYVLCTCHVWGIVLGSRATQKYMMWPQRKHMI